MEKKKIKMKSKIESKKCKRFFFRCAAILRTFFLKQKKGFLIPFFFLFLKQKKKKIEKERKIAFLFFKKTLVSNFF